jgi:pimeloyl-ACP methyl ester carboxylesterase
MTIASRRRVIRFTVLSLLLAGAECTPCEVLAQPDSAKTPQDMSAGVTLRAPDAFYDPPAQVPDRPGALLRSEPLQNVTLPAGMRGWRILYTTTVNDTTRATAVATVFAPVDLPAGPRPLIAWEHATVGLQQKCMPSLLSIPTLGIPALDRIVRAGWVIVATDYSFAEKGGPHPYLIGEGEARAALDSARAARQMPELTLDARTVVWGHSQGGQSALWTGIVAPRYAPEIEIAGVAAIAPATNLRNIIAVNQGIDKRLGPYVARAYSRFYPDMTFEQAIRPEALAAAREIAGLCGFLPAEEPVRAAALTTTFEGPALATRTNAALSARLAQNDPDRPIPAPVAIAQGAEDDVVPPAVTAGYVEERCAAGQRLEYWTFAGLDHGMVQPGSPLEEPLMAWTAARFANQPPPAGCTRKSF